MAQKVALINMKGGVGKSTLAANLAWAMASDPWHKNVLVIDLDPQFNCSQYLVGVRRIEAIISEGQPTIWDIFEQNTVVPGKTNSALDVWEAITSVYSSRRLENYIDLIPSRLELAHTLRNPTDKAHLLQRAVEELEEAYDFVIIDCAPTESVLTTAAYLVADYLLIPVRPEFLSTIGLPLLEQSLNEFASRYPSDLPEVLGLVFNAISGYSPEETTSRTEVQRVARGSGWPIFDAEIGYSKSYPKSAREGQPIFRTSYVRYSTTRRFHFFAREFVERIGL